MEDKHIIEIDPNYPRAMYKPAKKGDLLSPQYPRIFINDDGVSEKAYDRLPWVSLLVASEAEEKKAVANGYSREVPVVKE